MVSLVTLTSDGLEMSFPWEQATQDMCLGMILFSLREWPFEFRISLRIVVEPGWPSQSCHRVKLSIAYLLKVALASIILTLAW